MGEEDARIQEMDARPYLIPVINAVNSNADYGWISQYNIYDKKRKEQE